MIVAGPFASVGQRMVMYRWEKFHRLPIVLPRYREDGQVPDAVGKLVDEGLLLELQHRSVIREPLATAVTVLSSQYECLRRASTY